MTSHRDSDERMTPPRSHSPQDLRISQPASSGPLQPSSTSAFRRVSHSSPAVTSPAYRRDSTSSDQHSDHEDSHSYEHSHNHGFSDSHSKINGERLSPEQRNSQKMDSEKDNSNSSHRHVTPSKPKLSFSVEAIMASSSTSRKSPVTLSSHHHESRDSSFSSPGSSSSTTNHERFKENCSPASSEASSRGSDFHSPPPNPVHPHHPGYNVEGLLSKASVMPGRIPGEHGAGLPHPHPFLAAAGAGPDGIHWPWLGGPPPHPGATSSATGPLSKYKFSA